MYGKKDYIIIFSILSFLAGFYFCLTYSGSVPKQEGFETDKSCPNLLLKKGNVLLLYNSNSPEVPGQNPLPFYNLDEYINYLEIQRRAGKRCPVLFLQYENNAQGADVYRVRTSPFDMTGEIPRGVDPNLFIRDLGQLSGTVPTQIQGTPVKIIDASRDSGFNKGFAGFDPIGLHQGQFTELDAIHESGTLLPISDNPMDPNWGGVQYTKDAVDSGKYEDRYVAKPLLTNMGPGGTRGSDMNELPATLVPKQIKKVKTSENYEIPSGVDISKLHGLLLPKKKSETEQ